jgi:tRNA(Arg) A34 adenosine deaminase TadA
VTGPDFDSEMMRRALAAARAAALAGEVPVGAVLVDAAGVVLAEAHNRVEADRDPTAHAEMLVIRAAAARVQAKRLPGCTLYVTLEPCAMCAAAASFARLTRIVFAAADPKGGAVLHGPRFFAQPTCHWRCVAEGGLEAEAAGAMLRDFFRAKRSRPAS